MGQSGKSGNGGDAIPSSFLSWVEKPLADARKAVDAVPLRLDEHRAWLKVFREVNAAIAACRELRKLGRWLGGGDLPEIRQRQKPGRWHARRR